MEQSLEVQILFRAQVYSEQRRVTNVLVHLKQLNLHFQESKKILFFTFLFCAIFPVLLYKYSDLSADSPFFSFLVVCTYLVCLVGMPMSIYSWLRPTKLSFDEDGIHYFARRMSPKHIRWSNIKDIGLLNIQGSSGMLLIYLIDPTAYYFDNGLDVERKKEVESNLRSSIGHAHIVLNMSYFGSSQIVQICTLILKRIDKKDMFIKDLA